MSQYKTGTATVTNNSPTVTGTNTLWLANVTAGDSFTVAGDGVVYDVASVDTDTQVTLSVNYAGATAAGAVYAIGTGFTVPDNFPEMSQGDIETATIFTRAMRKIQGKFSSILAGGASANFTAMPQVGGDPIVESGSNADGEFTKWADGTLLCTKGFSITHSSSSFILSVDVAQTSVYGFKYSIAGSVAGSSAGKIDTIRTGGNGVTGSTSSVGTIFGTFDSVVETFSWAVVAHGRWK